MNPPPPPRHPANLQDLPDEPLWRLNQPDKCKADSSAAEKRHSPVPQLTAAICSTTDIIAVPSCTTTNKQTKGQSGLGAMTRTHRPGGLLLLLSFFFFFFS